MLPSHSIRDDAPSEPLCFRLGRDHEGHWVVQEEHGLYGGLFVSEIAAIRYAKFESANRGAVFEIAAGPIELNCGFR